MHLSDVAPVTVAPYRLRRRSGAGAEVNASPSQQEAPGFCEAFARSPRVPPGTPEDMQSAGSG